MYVQFLRTTISLLVLLQMASTVVLMTDGSPDETIYNELISRKRPILSMGKLAHSSQVVLLAGQLNKPEDIYVYEMPVAETTNISKLTLSGGVLLSEKWPVLYVELTKASTVFFVSDSSHDYVMLFATGYSVAYNIKDTNLVTVNISSPRNDFIMISSTDALSSFYMLPNEHFFLRFHYLYYGTINTKQVFLANTTVMRQIGGSLAFCSSTTSIMTILEHDPCPDGAKDCFWNIISGFADSQQITLFDQYGSVYMFARSSLDADLRIPVKLVTTKLSDYFVLSKNKPTIAPHTSNMSDLAVNTEGDRSNIGFIVVIAILVIILMLGIVLYFVNPCKTSSKKEKATKAAIIDSPKDKSVKATEKNGQVPKESVKPKAKDKTSAKVGQQKGKPGGRSGRRTPKTGHKGSGPHGSRSKQSGNAKSGHRSAAPSANSSQADSAMSAQSQPQNKSSSASSAPKKDSRSGAASSARKARRTPRKSTTRSPKKPFRGGKSEKKLIQLGLDQYEGNSLK